MGVAIVAYAAAIARSRMMNDFVKMSFLLAPTIGERPDAPLLIGNEIWNAYKTPLPNTTVVVVAGIEDGMGGLQGA